MDRTFLFSNFFIKLLNEIKNTLLMERKQIKTTFKDEIIREISITKSKKQKKNKRKKHFVKSKNKPKSIVEAIKLFPDYKNKNTRKINIIEIKSFLKKKMKRNFSNKVIVRELLDIAEFNEDYTKLTFRYDDSISKLNYINKLKSKVLKGERLDGFDEEYLKEYNADNSGIYCWPCRHKSRCFTENKRACKNFSRLEM
ncbi:MAG: hypothetical protein FH751_03165 [Firmicutes bacterium]|nr:hypothetical protein [Bacillota bacterium]